MGLHPVLANELANSPEMLGTRPSIGGGLRYGHLFALRCREPCSAMVHGPFGEPDETKRAVSP